jgi:alpha-tubulin suppressor-like RCC1 family protein
VVGELGDGTTTSSSALPDHDLLAGVQSVAVGFYHTCVVMQTGGVRCWGDNQYSQLGNHPSYATLTPVLGLCL